ncbi:hypothetical protein JCM11251_007312 [Rhodosporidiobolus azoricus]
MLSAPPTPVRPPCRTRRRSSSFSTFSSSPADDHHHHSWGTPPKKGSRHEGKRARRIDFRGGDSPLKQSQPLFAPIESHDSLSTPFWSQASPFSPAGALASTSSASIAAHAAPPPPSTSFFSANARDFSLPCSFLSDSTSFSTDATSSAPNPFQRNRHSSSGGSSSLSSSPPSSSSHPCPSGLVFEDSSFSSSHSSSANSTTSGYYPSSSPPQSLPSASTSPASATAAFTFSCPPPLSPPLPHSHPTLRRASSCHLPLFTPSSLPEAMLCDGENQDEDEAQKGVVEEAERLHHVAFEQLRHATSTEGEGLVERMKRWEAEQAASSFSLACEEEMKVVADVEEGDDEDVASLCDDEEEDEVELTLDLGHAAGPPSAGTRSDLDDLTRRLCAGACELEDFALVREVQARTRSIGRVKA